MEIKFGKLKKLKARDIWTNEASEFTPWLAENINILGEAIGLDLEVQEREASVGSFAVDIVCKELGSGRTVIIENQLGQSNHDHLGKILTYGAGLDAPIMVWVGDELRDEHRRVFEWLNESTESLNFFAVEVEILQIDKSDPAYNFKPVVYPYEKIVTPAELTPRGKAYKDFFQSLLNELRQKKFTGAKAAQPQNWYSYASGFSNIWYGSTFRLNNKVSVEIGFGGSKEDAKARFDYLYDKKGKIEETFNEPLEWRRMDEKVQSMIQLVREGSIEFNEETLKDIHEWIVEKLLKFKKIFTPFLKRYFEK